MSSTDPNQNGRPPPPLSPPSNGDVSSSSSQATVPNPNYASLPNFADRPQDDTNSVSQMLFHTGPLRWYFMHSRQTGETHLKFSRLFAYMMSEESEQDSTANTIELVSGNVQSDVTVQDLLDNCVDGVPSAHGDAQKYLAKVLANTIKESNTIRPEANSSPSFDLVDNGSQAWDHFCKLVEDTFVSRLLTVQFEVAQQHRLCGHQKKTWNWDEQIQVDIDLVENQFYSIKHYLKELLAKRLVYNKCTRCGLSQWCVQAAIVSRFPPYLVVYLNRFVSNKNKLTRQVEIDERFELCNRVYELVSVIIHKGTAKQGVHWTVVRERTDYWVVLANEFIYKGLDNARAMELLNRYAFVMMYKRVEDKNTLDDGLNDDIESALDSTVPKPNNPPSARSNGLKFSSKHPYCGLCNRRLVCYSNSILQVLYTCTKVRQYILAHLSTGRFHGLLAELFSQMQAQSDKFYSVIDPEFKFNPEFRRIRPEFKYGEMHDAPEYMTILLELIHQEANLAKQNKPPKETPVMSSADQAWDYHLTYGDNSYLSKLFMGQVESVLSCLRCGQSNKTWYPIWEWRLDVDIKTDQDGQKSELNLMHSIDHFSNVQILQDCTLHCASCQSAQTFSMRHSLHRLPHYLKIYLTRFTATGEKLNRALHILEHLNLLGQSCTLSSVVCHKGSVNIGHYYTIVRQGQNEWVKLDDESICNIDSTSAHHLLDNFAYLCIYEVLQTTPEKEVKPEQQDK